MVMCVIIIESRMNRMNSILQFLEFRVLNWLWNILRTKTNLRLLPRGGRVILNLRGGEMDRERERERVREKESERESEGGGGGREREKGEEQEVERGRRVKHSKIKGKMKHLLVSIPF